MKAKKGEKVNSFKNPKEFQGLISSPGRICLYGEHQDYLGLPVIPLAINRRLELFYQGNPEQTTIQFSSENLDLIEEIDHSHIDELTESPFDYIKAAFKFFKHEISGKYLPSEINIRSTIPIKAGLSSSAALIVSTVFLIANVILKENLTDKQIAELAYQIEHDILGISCGRMDQASSALGGLFHMTTSGTPQYQILNLPKNSFFVIGNSEVPRKADIPLKHVQNEIFSVLNLLDNPDLFTFQKRGKAELKLSTHQSTLLTGILETSKKNP